jgi:hypothetical protein
VAISTEGKIRRYSVIAILSLIKKKKNQWAISCYAVVRGQQIVSLFFFYI